VYSTPDYLSRPVANLIEKLLTVDPLKRATVKDIREHEWFKINLPEYLFPKATNDNINIVDIEAILEICEKFSVDESTVQDALMDADPHDEYVIAYHLIIDNKRITEAQNSQNRVHINDFFVASSPPTTSFFMDMHVKPISPLNTSNTTQSVSQYHHPTNIENPSHQTVHPERMPPLKDVNATLDNEPKTDHETKKPAKKAKWHLGIRSQSKPQDIMNEVFKAMKASKMQWKYYNSSIYNLRVRKQVAPDRYVKAGLQLYQVDQKSYLLDFRSFEPSPGDAVQKLEKTKGVIGVDKESNHHFMMEFFELCAGLIGSLAR